MFSSNGPVYGSPVGLGGGWIFNPVTSKYDPVSGPSGRGWYWTS